MRSKDFRSAMARADYSGRMACAEPRVTVVDLRKVYAAAARDYARMNGTPHESPARIVARQPEGQAFLDRIAINHIRHELSDYDVLLATVSASEHGGATLANMLRRKTYKAIMRAYPALAAACETQMAQRERMQMAKGAKPCAGRRRTQDGNGGRRS